MSEELPLNHPCAFDDEVSAWLDLPDEPAPQDESHEENLQWIGSFLTGDFDDDWADESLASVA